MLNLSQKTVKNTVQHLKELLKVNFEILHKTKRKNNQLINFASSLKCYHDFFQFFFKLILLDEFLASLHVSRKL